MKKQLFLLFSLLFLGTWSIAQIDLTVNGVVVDPMGNPVPNVTIYVETDSTFAGAGYFNTLTTDAAGAFSDAFTLNSAPSQGALYLTMVNCQGQPNVSVTSFWNPGNYDFTYTFLYCEPLPPVCEASIAVDSVGMGLMLTGESTGSAPFTYVWNNGETSPSITPNTFGTFCVTITDAAGCSDEACYTIDPPVPCDVVVFQGQMDDLIASVTGSGPFTFIWNTNESTSSIQPTTTGTYCVTISDGMGCSASDCFFYTAMPGDSCSVDLIVNPNPAGNLWDITANPTGTAPFSYQWDTGAQAQSITVQVPATYCVTITDADGCEVVACATIPNNTPCDVFINVSALGDLTAIPSGVSPYTYDWSTGANTASITPTVTGTYCVTITDATGCTATECYVFAGACSVSFSSMPVGNNAAVATATATGAAPFTYIWDTGETTASILVTQPAMYCVTMSDANGCTAVY
ncbi:MAG: carboxypeptidase-like regulatory domain-containing protein, partial [Bacteroidota bacterium]